MNIVVIILSGVIFVLLAYIYFFKKEILNISNQLDEYNRFATDKKIDINIINKEIEILAESINKHMDISIGIKLDEIKRKDELKEMVANISHDLRTPLTSIIGYIQMLKLKANGDEKDKEYIYKIEKRAKDLQGMLEDFFMLSLVENEDYKIQVSQINISDILCDSVIKFYDEFEKLNMEPLIKIEEDCICFGNEHEIKRIIENLIGNLLKYTTGNNEIRLKNSGDWVEISIINSIEDVNLDVTKLFDKLYKGNDKSRRGKSTGLGLSIVKTLVEKMQGQVSAKLIDSDLKITCRFKKACRL